MIFGICSKDSIKFNQEFRSKYKSDKSVQSKASDKFGFSYFPEKINTDQKKYSGLWQDKKTKYWFLFQGHIFNIKQLQEKYGLEDSIPFSQLVSKMYATDGTKCFKDLNGHFAVAIYDENDERLVLVRDHFGVEPLYFYKDETKIIFSSDPLFLLKHDFIPKEINHKGLYTYFLFNYLPTSETIIANLAKVRPAFSCEWKKGNISSKRYWYLSFKQGNGNDESYYTENTLRLLKDAVKIRLENNGKKSGAFLSGGMDSSSVVGLSGPNVEKKMNTFSFRCKGQTDESHYAKFMSEAYGTDHHLVEFPHEATRKIVDMAEIMPEPFCDIGIEIASFLLAQYASGKVDYILSGDGGDELFAGHPVYIADNVAKYFDMVPGFIQKPIINLLQLLPDTDKKKSLPVKAKRFSYSFNFSASLFSNRWRIYYTPKELNEALESDLWAKMKDQDPLPEIESFYNEADGEDFLSKTLYGDYATVVNFYLTRMSILRHYGIEAKFPMFDYRLVEFAAAMPSDLKIKGNSDTKYILKKTMTGVLPDEIVFRKDKLGHSVPMKNWMRDSPELIGLVDEILTEENIKKRGFFKPEFVRKMIDDHKAKKVNHSHRIWALLVLELWLQKHFD
jgi:asparagine synthase (glutamine-hydrolysing)